MKTNAMAFALVAACVIFCGCDKRKGPMTLHAGEADVAAYKAAFEKYFKVEAIDATKHGYKPPLPMPRYWVRVMSPENAPKQNVSSGRGFCISIYDNGSTVDLAIIYMVGAKGEDVAFVNPNMGSGKVTFTQTATLTPKHAKGDPERVADIAGLVHQVLDQILGELTKK